MRRLEALKVQLTKQGKIEDAVAVTKEIERLKSSDKETASPSDAKIIGASADAMVRAMQYKDTNYGNEPELLVKDDGSENSRRAFLDLICPPLKDLKAPISNARIRLTGLHFNGRGSPDFASLTKTQNWEETKITWSNQPEFGKTVAEWQKPDIGQAIEFDVTHEVRKMIASDTDLSICVHTNGFHHTRYASREHDDEPIGLC